MRKLAARMLVVVTLVVVPATPSLARGGHFGGHGHGGWHGRVIIGGPWGWDPWWGPRYPYPYGYYPPPYAVPPAVVEGSSEYIEQRPLSEERQQGYWYYCASAKAYYPTVEKCPEDWIRVPPAPQ